MLTPILHPINYTRQLHSRFANYPYLDLLSLENINFYLIKGIIARVDNRFAELDDGTGVVTLDMMAVQKRELAYIPGTFMKHNLLI